MRYTRPPYMYDVLPAAPPKEAWLELARWRSVEGLFRDVCRRYGYREIRTPIFEHTELFTRTIGESTDIVSKEMFTFSDRGERSLTLKPEGTAPAARACIENGLLGDGQLRKLYYIGQNFRAERGQRGRYRQHQQLGVEAFGSADPAIDAEVILLAMEFYSEVGITGQELRINSVGTPESRAGFKEALREHVKPFLSEMSVEGQNRFVTNPLRMLDTKDERDLRLLENVPRLVDFLDPESRAHFESLQAYLSAAGVSFVVDHRLVRGFDYYTRTAFEIVSTELGAQNALGGGGRYDLLVQECGGPPTPGIGFGLGTERCLLALEALGVELSVEDERPFAFIVTLGSDAVVRPTAVRLLNQLRAAGVPADMSYAISRKFDKQIKRADELGARYAIILGEGELERNVVGLRNQQTKEQKDVPLSDVVNVLHATQSELTGGTERISLAGHAPFGANS